MAAVLALGLLSILGVLSFPTLNVGGRNGRDAAYRALHSWEEGEEEGNLDQESVMLERVADDDGGEKDSVAAK